MRSTYHMSARQAWDTPLAEAFALRAWALETNSFAAVTRTTSGYVQQEVARRMQNGHRGRFDEMPETPSSA